METNKFDKGLEFLVMGGFLAVMAALIRWNVPEANNQLFGQALGALTVIVTLVGKSIWERNSSEAKLTEKRVENNGAAFEAITAAANSAPPGFIGTPDQQVVAAAEATADAAANKADEIAHGKRLDHEPVG